MKRILVVDDIKANRLLLRKTLVAINEFEVIEAESGREAIAQLKNDVPDLILMDVNMPDMDGYQATSSIKEITGENHIPIIFVTALSAKDSLSLSLESGGDDFISKPFDVEVLASKINAHLRIRDLNQQLNEKNNRLTEFNQYLSNEHELIDHFFSNALKQSYLDERIIKYHMSSMSVFNGDLLLVERGPRGGIYLLMGDFTGHGLTAAMGTLPVAMIFFEMSKKGAAIGEIARELNQQLNKLLPFGMFLAATLLEVNARGDTMTVWMGGVPESYWLGTNGELKGEIHSQYMPLGILDDMEFDATASIFTVESGDKLYLYSDGITEAQSHDEEMFGNHRLKEVLTTNQEDRFDQVLLAIAGFTSEVNQSDDITFVELTCRNVPAADPVDPVIENATVQADVLPWKLSIPLTEKDMLAGEPVAKLSNMLGSMPGLIEHKGALHVLLSEMYSNALDHSILGLDSVKKTNDEQFANYYQEREEQLRALKNASILIELHFFSDVQQQYLEIKITDNGRGYTGHASNSSNDQLHGRGLEIITSFCKSVTFSNDGKTLAVVYPV